MNNILFNAMKIPAFCAFIIGLTSCSNNNNVGNSLNGNGYVAKLNFEVNKSILLNTYSKDIKIIKVREEAEKNVLAENLSFIKLVTPEHQLVGTINKLKYGKDRFYILDKMTNSLHIFCLDGNLIRSIRAVGKGPGEYVQLGDFALSDENKHVILFDRKMWKMLYFDFEGNYLYEKKINYWFSDFETLSDGMFVTYSGGGPAGSGYNIFIVTPEKFKARGVPYLEQNENLHAYQNSSPFFWTYKDKVKAVVPFNDTIYQISSDTIKAQYVMDFGRKKLPSGFLKYTTKEFIEKIDETSFAYSLGSGFETEVYLGIDIIVVESGLKKGKNMLLNKKTGESLVCSILDKDYGLRTKLPISTKGSDTLVTVYYAHEIASKKSQEGASQKLLEFAETVNELDNPILATYTLSGF